jgi:hypothetical protein
MYTSFWAENIRVLYDRNHFLEIFPSRDFDMIRKLNALFRFSIYYSVIVYVYRRSFNVFYIPLITGIITYLIYKKNDSISLDNIKADMMMNNPVNNEQLSKLNSECKIPTKDNPFMNPTLDEYSNNKDVKGACLSFDNKGVQEKIDELFHDDLFRDYTDIFNNKNSQRQFYTVPGNNVPNGQGDFAQWCYGQPPTCKEGNRLDCLSFRNGGGMPSGGVGSS